MREALVMEEGGMVRESEGGIGDGGGRDGEGE